MPQELRDKLKMLFRYAVSMGVMYATAKGWIVPEKAGLYTTIILEGVGYTVACIPSAYAWFMVRNDKKRRGR